MTIPKPTTMTAEVREALDKIRARLVKSMSPRNKPPRERLAETLENNIKRLHDPDFTVSTPAGPRPPVRCHEIVGNKARVWGVYLGKRVPIGDGDCIEVEKDKAEEALSVLAEIARSGKLDDALQQIAEAKKRKV